MRKFLFAVGVYFAVCIRYDLECLSKGTSATFSLPTLAADVALSVGALLWCVSLLARRNDG